MILLTLSMSLDLKVHAQEVVAQISKCLSRSLERLPANHAVRTVEDHDTLAPVHDSAAVLMLKTANQASVTLVAGVPSLKPKL